MKILATDLDRTLLPNGRWPADEGAIAMFNELTEKHDVLVVYVTGRSLALVEQAIREYAIRYPHVLISDVGTSIRKYTANAWQVYSGWDEHIKRTSPKWNAEAVRQAVSDINGMVEQEHIHCGPFKQSYFVEHNHHKALLKTVAERVKGHYDEAIIYSYDSQSGRGLLDFLPQSATKQTALEYLAQQYHVSYDDVVFCGDSGNDIQALTAGFCGVMVRNADEQLLANVKIALQQNPNLRIYHAKGDGKLSGYYTSGVIEGACYYGGLLSD